VKFLELSLYLDKRWGCRDLEKDAALSAVSDRRAKDGFKVVGTTREKSRDVGERAWMVSDKKFDDHGGSK